MIVKEVRSKSVTKCTVCTQVSNTAAEKSLCGYCHDGIMILIKDKAQYLKDEKRNKFFDLCKRCGSHCYGDCQS